MKTEDLVRKANQIAAFFAPYPEAEAVEGVVGHMRSFWEPRMRRQLADHIAAGGAGLSPLARKAGEKLMESA
ncbi:MAG: formate dehydrogenase subunit delta [Azospirillaceae bacterium]